jgi:hypothetical protein
MLFPCHDADDCRLWWLEQFQGFSNRCGGVNRRRSACQRQQCDAGSKLSAKRYPNSGLYFNCW